MVDSRIIIIFGVFFGFDIITLLAFIGEDESEEMEIDLSSF